MLKQLLEQATSNNGKARLYAFENTVELTNLIPPTVSYESGGNTLIVGQRQSSKVRQRNCRK